MKRFVAIILTAAMLISCFAMTSFAAKTDEITVTRSYFTIDTGAIDIGTDPSDIDERFVKINWIEEKNSDGTPVYPGLAITPGQLECTSPKKAIKIGDTITLKFYADITSGSGSYIFTSKSKASVTATDGSEIKVKSVTTSRDGYYGLKVTVTLKPLKGQYSEPQDLEWKTGTSLGQAKWSKPEDENCSGAYDIRLRRNDKTVAEFACVSGTSMNFYPWMTNEGDYTFEVRCVPNTDSSNAKKSEWAQSDSQYVDKNKVSDGSGQFDPSGSAISGGTVDTNTTQVGWVKINNTWYYRYPDGKLRTNGWEKISGKWYYFDSTGAMKTGWTTVNNQTYYLDPTNGDMKTGWVKTSDGQWYYLNPDPTSSTQGAMLKNQWADINGKRYYFKSSGAMATGWQTIDGKYYYFNPANGADLGALVRNQRIDSFYVGEDGAWVRGA